jgi:metal-responsive CopG/Arc/MetJ family transcriptional regulator
MKAIKIIIDDNLLERFDTDPDVSLYGRSTVLAKIISDFLDEKDPKAAKESNGAGKTTTRKRAKSVKAA